MCDTDLSARDVVDLGRERLRERLSKKALCSLDAQIDDLSVQLVVLLLQTAVILHTHTHRTKHVFETSLGSVFSFFRLLTNFSPSTCESFEFVYQFESVYQFWI